MLNIDIVGQATKLSWYEIWEATVALAAMCVRVKEKGGKASGLGQYDSKLCYRGNTQIHKDLTATSISHYPTKIPAQGKS